MTDQPVIVERDEARNATFGQRADDGRRQAGQMMDVRDIGFEVVDHPAGDRADGFVPIGLLERPRVAERVVHPDDAQAVARLGRARRIQAAPDPAPA